MMSMTASDLPLERIARGKVRDVYAVDADRLLLVATDRVSAYDVVMAEPIPQKGAVLTQVSAWWFRQLGDVVKHHMISADAGEIAAAVPERLRPIVLDPASLTSSNRQMPPDLVDVAPIRAAIHSGRKIVLDYRDELGRATNRKVWPVTIGYLETVRMLVAWCELRQDFRHFRTDRIQAVEVLDDRAPERPAALRVKWRKTQKHSRENPAS